MLRRSERPLGAYLLRIVRTERLDLVYDLIELRDGRVHRFVSLAALRRFLRGSHGAAAAPAAAPIAGPRRK